MSARPRPVSRQDVTGLVLAGGRGQRMGGVDKGLQSFRGRPLAGQVLDRLAPQVGALVISANRHASQYEALGLAYGGGLDLRLVADRELDFAGPLAGIAAGLAACRSPWLACAPCDAPWLPTDLVARLTAAIDVAAIVDRPTPGAAPQLALPRSPAGLQPVHALLHRDLLPELQAFLAKGGRKVGDWLAAIPHVEVRFDDEAAFANANTAEELARLAQRAP